MIHPWGNDSGICPGPLKQTHEGISLVFVRKRVPHNHPGIRIMCIEQN